MDFIVFFLFGAAFGSFLNVLIDRLSTGRSPIKGRSYCENCKKTLGYVDLIPIFSYIFLKGKCRYCKAKIPSRLLIVEILSGVVALLVYLFFITGNVPIVASIALFIVLFCFLGIFFADIKYGLIPDGFVISAIISSFIYISILKLPFFVHFLSGAVSLIFFLFLFLITKGKGMGFGDVKLSFVLGFFLGFPDIITALYLAFLTGAGVSIILVIWKKLRFFGGTIPFGPFLVAATVVTFLFGDVIADSFINTFIIH